MKSATDSKVLQSVRHGVSLLTGVWYQDAFWWRLTFVHYGAGIGIVMHFLINRLRQCCVTFP